MNADQRRAVAAEITRAREAQGLSAAQLAKRAGISENTMTKVVRGESVYPSTLQKLREALGLEPLAETAAARYPPDIELIRDAIGLWLLDMEPVDRPDVVRRILRAVADR